MLQEIQIQEIENFKIGSAEDQEARTGVTVVLCEAGANTGADISGGGPACRETGLTSDLSAPNPIHGVMLAGGSAFGLDAASGVMRYLEERGIGYPTGFANVPLVVGSCIYDLGVGSSTRRPDPQMGYDACVAAEKNAPMSGSYGAGCGATVGKLCGMAQADASGLGIYAVQLGALKMGAVVSVNALGDVFDFETGQKLAGLRTPDRTGFADSEETFYQLALSAEFLHTNTTIGVIITNGAFSRREMNRIASMARAGYARSINPVATLADGDTIYAMSCGTVRSDVNLAGTLAARVMAAAVRNAVLSVKQK